MFLLKHRVSSTTFTLQGMFLIISSYQRVSASPEAKYPKGDPETHKTTPTP